MVSNDSEDAKEDSPLLKHIDRRDVSNSVRSVTFGVDSVEFQSSTLSNRSSSISIFLKDTLLSPSERERALQTQEGVGPAAFLIRDAVLGEEEHPYETWYNPYADPANERRNFFAAFCARSSSSVVMVRILKVAAWTLVILSFVEPPYWCRRSHLVITEDSDKFGNGFGVCGVLLNAAGPSLDGEEMVTYYPNSSSMWLTEEQSTKLEGLCLFIITLYLFLRFGRDGFEVQRFLMNGYNRFTRTLQLLMILLLIRGLITHNTELNPLFRLALLGTFTRGFQREVRTLVKMVRLMRGCGLP